LSNFTFLSRIFYLNPAISRFDPKLLYWIFISCDIGSLSLQGAGGGLSSTSSGSSRLGQDISLVGLSFQVFTLVVFILLGIDYLVRFSWLPGQTKTSFRFKVYLLFLSVSTILILGRCIYRIDELRDGYNGALFHNEGMLYGFESVYVFSYIIMHWLVVWLPAN
jgi:RTA1 like protein